MAHLHQRENSHADGKHAVHKRSGIPRQGKER
jgi:hypothetical protein